MNTWTLGSFLGALVLVILGGAAVGWLVQRLLPKDDKPEEGMALYVRWQKRKLRSSAFTLVGLALALVLYPLLSRGGMTGLFGLSAGQTIFGIAGAVALVLSIAWYKRKHRDEE